jgi:hypothetical protein
VLKLCRTAFAPCAFWTRSASSGTYRPANNFPVTRSKLRTACEICLFPFSQPRFFDLVGDDDHKHDHKDGRDINVEVAGYQTGSAVQQSGM